jgi:hypothetical protein
MAGDGKGPVPAIPVLALMPVPRSKWTTRVFRRGHSPVTLIVPATLSPESYQDMADRIEIFLRGLKRRSDAEAAQRRANRDDVPD